MKKANRGRGERRSIPDTAVSEASVRMAAERRLASLDEKKRRPRYDGEALALDPG